MHTDNLQYTQLALHEDSVFPLENDFASGPPMFALQFWHDCQTQACADLACPLCRHNPKRRCRAPFKSKYLVRDELKATCGGSICVVVIEEATGALVEGALPDIDLELTVLNGTEFAQRSNSASGEAVHVLDDDELMLCAVPTNNVGRPLLDGKASSVGASFYHAANSSIRMPLKGMLALSELFITDSSEALLPGQRPPFRLLARAVASNTGQRVPNIRNAVSDDFVVATRRVGSALKAEIPMINDRVAKLVHIGAGTVGKLKDLFAAARECDIYDLPIPPELRSIISVGQFRELCKLAEANAMLKAALLKILRLCREKWDEAALHAYSAVLPDNRMRVWFNPHAAQHHNGLGINDNSFQAGLLFACQNGNVTSCIGVIARRIVEEDGKRMLRCAIQVGESLERPDLRARVLETMTLYQPLARDNLMQDGHPGWEIFPFDHSAFLQKEQFVRVPELDALDAMPLVAPSADSIGPASSGDGVTLNSGHETSDWTGDNVAYPPPLPHAPAAMHAYNAMPPPPLQGRLYDQHSHAAQPPLPPAARSPHPADGIGTTYPAYSAPAPRQPANITAFDSLVAGLPTSSQPPSWQNRGANRGQRNTGTEWHSAFDHHGAPIGANDRAASVPVIDGAQLQPHGRSNSTPEELQHAHTFPCVDMIQGLPPPPSSFDFHAGLDSIPEVPIRGNNHVPPSDFDDLPMPSSTLPLPSLGPDSGLSLLRGLTTSVMAGDLSMMFGDLEQHQLDASEPAAHTESKPFPQSQDAARSWQPPGMQQQNRQADNNFGSLQNNAAAFYGERHDHAALLPHAMDTAMNNDVGNARGNAAAQPFRRPPRGRNVLSPRARDAPDAAAAGNLTRDRTRSGQQPEYEDARSKWFAERGRGDDMELPFTAAAAPKRGSASAQQSQQRPQQQRQQQRPDMMTLEFGHAAQPVFQSGFEAHEPRMETFRFSPPEARAPRPTAAGGATPPASSAAAWQPPSATAAGGHAGGSAPAAPANNIFFLPSEESMAMMDAMDRSQPGHQNHRAQPTHMTSLLFNPSMDFDALVAADRSTEPHSHFKVPADVAAARDTTASAPTTATAAPHGSSNPVSAATRGEQAGTSARNGNGNGAVHAGAVQHCDENAQRQMFRTSPAGSAADVLHAVGTQDLQLHVAGMNIIAGLPAVTLNDGLPHSDVMPAATDGSWPPSQQLAALHSDDLRSLSGLQEMMSLDRSLPNLDRSLPNLDSVLGEF